MKYQTSEKYLLHRIEQMESEIGNLKTDKKNLNEDLLEANKRATVYCSENGQLKEQIYQMSESGKQADEELAKAAEEVQKSAEQIVDELNKTREERDEYKVKWQNLMGINQNNIDRYSVALREKEAEIEDLKEQKQKLEEELSKTKEMLHEWNGNAMIKVNGEWRNASDYLRELRDKIDELQKELDYQTRKCKEQEDAVNNSKFAFDVTWADHEKLKQENEDLKTRYGVLNALHIDLSENYDGAKRNIDELSTQLEKVRKDKDEMGKAIERLKSQLRNDEAKEVARKLLDNISLVADLGNLGDHALLITDTLIFQAEEKRNILNFISHYARLPQELRELKNKLNEQAK